MPLLESSWAKYRDLTPWKIQDFLVQLESQVIFLPFPAMIHLSGSISTQWWEGSHLAFDLTRQPVQGSSEPILSFAWKHYNEYLSYSHEHKRSQCHSQNI